MPPAARKPSVRPFKGFTESIDEPLEFLRSETYRLRQAAEALERVADGESRADEILSACEFLSVELPLHLLDVKSDLHALLSKNCKPVDNIEPVVAELISVQGAIRTKGPKTVSALLRQIERGPAKRTTPATRRLASELATSLSRLLAIESGILIPLARVRLGSDELVELGNRMKLRRGKNNATQSNSSQ